MCRSRPFSGPALSFFLFGRCAYPILLSCPRLLRPTGHHALIRAILRAFAVTVRLLANIATTATSGLRKPKAATGMAITL